MNFILASKSPRRIELLQKAGFVFETQPAEIDESPLPDEKPEDFVLRMAFEKAECIAKNYAEIDPRIDPFIEMNHTGRRPQITGGHMDPPLLVLAADTIVTIENRILGKPQNENEAFDMLKMLSGTSHIVMTAYTLWRTSDHQVFSDVEKTTVTFRKLSDEEMKNYIQTGEPMDKAGAYGIQGKAGQFVTHVEGSLNNVIGLPVEVITPKIKKLLGN